MRGRLLQPKASKQLQELAQLKAENAQLRAQNASLKKASGVSKTMDVYRAKLYNEMVDSLVNLMKQNRKVIHRVDVSMPSLDSTFNPSIALLRDFQRRRMTKSPGKLEASKHPES